MSWFRGSVAELKRRRVFRVAVVYGIVAWIVVQVAVSTFPYLDLPPWLVTAVIVLAVLGFPLALVLAWSLELTPEGVRPERGPSGKAGAADIPGGQAAADAPRAVWLMVGLALAAGLAAYLTWWAPTWGGAEPGVTGAEAEGAHPADVRRLRQVTFSPAMEEWPEFIADGERLLFSREVDGFRQLFLIDLSTGRETRLTDAPVDHIQPAWAPDGRTVLYVRPPASGRTLAPSDIFGPYLGGEIWTLDLGTGGTRKLLEGAYNPCFSPDGTRIAFDASWVGPRRVWVADAVGRNPVQVTGDATESVHHIAPRWSPDGSMLAFQSIEGTNFDVRTVHLTSRAIRRVTDDPFANLNPVWSAEGDWIYFSSNRGGGLNLWRVAVTPEGAPVGTPTQVTMGAGQDVEPAVSRDGTRIAFVIRSQNAELWRLPVDPGAGRPTGSPEPLVASTREESRGAWSPDGRQVAFNSDRTGDMNLWVHDLEDGNAEQVTRGPGGDFQPRWSPDGRRLVFFSSRAGNTDIWTVDLDTGTLVQLTSDSALQVNPFYSPDGRRIAFQSDRGGRKEVWVMDADGSNQRQLSHTGVRDHFMLWGEEGRSVIYSVPGRADSAQVEISLDGGEPRLFPTVMGGAHMSFGPDRDRILDVVGHRTLWITPLSEQEPVRLFEFNDPEVRIDYPDWSPDGRWILFERRKPGGGDVWLLELGESGGH